jgi:hypothetical protein
VELKVLFLIYLGIFGVCRLTNFAHYFAMLSADLLVSLIQHISGTKLVRGGCRIINTPFRSTAPLKR